MGVWGTGIFEDDTACDIRDNYKDCLGDGITGPAATKWILNEFEDSLAEPSESGVVWLALAAVQWQYGRLDDETRERALHVIDFGSDLARWDAGTKDFASRKIVLEKLRTQITSPQPLEKKVARRVPSECHLKRGDLIVYQLPSGIRTILRVIDRHTDRGGTYPVCELMDWTGQEIPSQSALKGTDMKRSRADYKHTITQVMICGLDENSTRVEKLDFKLKPVQKHEGATVALWKRLDEFLGEWFLLK